jgi:O-antigen/teichoic acid export membrane protein
MATVSSALSAKADTPRPTQGTEAVQAGILVIGQIATTLTQAILPWFLVRMLAKDEVGAFSALMLVYNTLAMLMTAGFPPAVLYFNSQRSRADRASLVWRAFGLTHALGLLAGLLMWGLAHVDLDVADPQALTHLALFPFLDLPSRIIPNVLLSEQRPRAAAMFGVLKALGMLAGTLVPAALGLGLDGMVTGLLLFGLVQTVALIVWLRRLYRAAGPPERRIGVGHLFRFSIPLGMTDIINVLNASLDSYLIMSTMTAAVFAEYRMGAWQIPLVTSTAYSVGAVYLPRFVKLLEAGQGAEVLGIWRHSIRKVSLIVVPICAVFVVGAEEFVALAFTADYSGAAPVFRLYSILTMARVTAFASLLVAAGKPGYVLRASALTILSNAAISVPLLWVLGYLGPPAGAVIAFVPAVAIYCAFIARALKQPISATFPVVTYLRIVGLAMVPGALAVGLKLVITDAPGLLFSLEALTILVGFALIGTLSGEITRDDWRFLRDWVRLKGLRRGAT